VFEHNNEPSYLSAPSSHTNAAAVYILFVLMLPHVTKFSSVWCVYSVIVHCLTS